MLHPGGVSGLLFGLSARGDAKALVTAEPAVTLLLTPFDPEVAAQVEEGREFMKEYRSSFKVLAKRLTNRSGLGSAFESPPASA
jgi:hypothetical protein